MNNTMVIIADTREKKPLTFLGIPTIKKGLKTGDYSILGYEDIVSVERKSLPDLLACVSKERKRFEKCIDRLLEFECRAIVLESTPHALENGGWRSKVKPKTVVASVMSWKMRGIPFIYAATHNQAAQYTLQFLKLFWAHQKRLEKLK